MLPSFRGWVLADLRTASDVLAKWVAIVSAIIGGTLALNTYASDVSGRLTGRQSQSLERIQGFNEGDALAMRGVVLAAADRIDTVRLDIGDLRCFAFAIRENSSTEPCFAGARIPFRTGSSLASQLQQLKPIEIISVARVLAENLARRERVQESDNEIASATLGPERLALFNAALGQAESRRQQEIAVAALQASPVSVAGIIDYLEEAHACIQTRLCDESILRAGMRRYARTYLHYLSPYITDQREISHDPSFGASLEYFAEGADMRSFYHLPEMLSAVEFVDLGQPLGMSLTPATIERQQ